MVIFHRDTGIEWDTASKWQWSFLISQCFGRRADMAILICWWNHLKIWNPILLHGFDLDFPHYRSATDWRKSPQLDTPNSYVYIYIYTHAIFIYTIYIYIYTYYIYIYNIYIYTYKSYTSTISPSYPHNLGLVLSPHRAVAQVRNGTAGTTTSWATTVAASAAGLAGKGWRSRSKGGDVNVTVVVVMFGSNVLGMFSNV